MPWSAWITLELHSVTLLFLSCFLVLHVCLMLIPALLPPWSLILPACQLVLVLLYVSLVLLYVKSHHQVSSLRFSQPLPCLHHWSSCLVQPHPRPASVCAAPTVWSVSFLSYILFLVYCNVNKSCHRSFLHLGPLSLRTMTLLICILLEIEKVDLWGYCPSES